MLKIFANLMKSSEYLDVYYRKLIGFQKPTSPTSKWHCQNKRSPCKFHMKHSFYLCNGSFIATLIFLCLQSYHCVWQWVQVATFQQSSLGKHEDRFVNTTNQKLLFVSTAYTVVKTDYIFGWTDHLTCNKYIFSILQYSTKF